MASAGSRHRGPDAPRLQNYNDNPIDEKSGCAQPIRTPAQHFPQSSLMLAPAALPTRSGPLGQQSSQSRHSRVEDAISDDRKRRRDSFSSSSSESSSNSSHNQRPPRKRHEFSQSTLDPNAALAIATNRPLPQATHQQHDEFLYKNALTLNTRGPAKRRSGTEELDALDLQVGTESPMMHEPKVGAPLHVTSDGS